MKHILIGVTGGIAAYKVCNLVSKLVQKDYEVQVIMTQGGMRFVNPMTFEALSKHPVWLDTNRVESGKICHIELAEWADLIVVAPASANIIAKMVNGMADNLLTETVLAAQCPILLAPAMNVHMLENPLTQSNLEKARKAGFQVLESESGWLACGSTGQGRLPETAALIEAIEECLALHAGQPTLPVQKEEPSLPLQGKTVLVSAGPTREAIDPVRFITNHSSGRQGYELADQALELGARVILVSGPVHLKAPEKAELITVESALEMQEAIEKNLDRSDFLVMAAAVADYRPETISPSKIKKNEDHLNLRLVKNPDILKGLESLKRDGQIFCGFAMETEDLEENARKKFEEKPLDMIVANSLTTPGAGFQNDTNIVTVLTEDGKEDYPLLSKKEVSRRLLLRMKELADQKLPAGGKGNDHE